MSLFVSEGEPLTSLCAHAHNPCYTPDGRCILFQSDHEGSPQVYRVEVGGGIPRPYGGDRLSLLTEVAWAHTHPAVSCRSLVAVQREEKADGEGVGDCSLVPVVGGTDVETIESYRSDPHDRHQ